jgi:hypothetical protein
MKAVAASYMAELNYRKDLIKESAELLDEARFHSEVCNGYQESLPGSRCNHSLKNAYQAHGKVIISRELAKSTTQTRVSMKLHGKFSQRRWLRSAL